MPIVNTIHSLSKVSNIYFTIWSSSSKTFAFSELNDDDITHLFESDSLDDYNAASPLYTSDAFKAQFKDTDYFLDRYFLIDDLIFSSQMMELYP